MDLKKDRSCVVVAIDYFTIFIVAEVIPDVKAVIVKKMVKKWCSSKSISELLITGNDREF